MVASILVGLVALSAAAALFFILRASPPGLSIVSVTSPPVTHPPARPGPLSTRVLNPIEVAPDTSLRVALRSQRARQRVIVIIAVAPWGPGGRLVARGTEISLPANAVRFVTLAHLGRLLPAGAWGVMELVTVTVRDLDRNQGQTRTYPVLFGLA
jgi:hypothetical protein